MLYQFLCLLFIISIAGYGFYISRECRLLSDTKVIINKPYDKLMIVAHPDDESLWGYYQLNSEKGWKIICITNSENNVRVNEIKNIANHFDAALEMWNFQDSPIRYNFSPIIYKKIFNEINKQNVKMVVTHNPLGEYGHIQHKKVSQIVLTVSNKPTYVFSYSSDNIHEKNPICKLKKYYESQHDIFEGHCAKNNKFKLYRVN